MKASVLPLVLLLCVSGAGAQGDSESEVHSETSALTDAQTAALPSIWAELKDLRNMVQNLGTTVAVQRAELGNMEARLKTSDGQVVDLKVELSVAKTELQFNKIQLEEVKRKNEAMETRLRASENQVDEQGGELRGLKSQMEELKTASAAQAAELSAMGSRVTATENRPEVAFSAALAGSGYMGPFDVATTLVYSTVFTNIGQAYNSITGVFTAPVRGAYYFRYTAGNIMSAYMGVKMYKNDQGIVSSYQYNTDNNWDYASNSAVLELKIGDVVYMRLDKSHSLYDNQNNLNSFSGFLLFTM